MRVAALDVGDRRIGFALADPTGTIVSRTGTLPRTGDEDADCEAVADLVREHSVATLVVGHPVHLSGRVGAQALLVEKFVACLKEHLKARGLTCGIVLWDERLSSVVAAAYLRETGKRGRPRTKGRVDAMAAGVILQGYLERNADATW
ncbi:MAG: Holliday junction resolvase RuvX [Anaerolineae bacterium]